MKHLEDTPWWICDEGDFNFCAYVDTDSNYFNAEPLLKFLYPNFEDFEDQEKDDILEKVALKYEGIITKHYDELARDCFNVSTHRLEMKTECVIRSAYFRATRRYAQWITKQEGIAKESLDIKGLEFMKANFPPILGKFFNDILQQVLKGEEKESIINQVKVFKKQILDGTIPLAKLGNPSAVKKLEKYSGKNARAGEMFSSFRLKAPSNTKAAVRYNDLLKFKRLDKQYESVVEGDKIFIINLKANPYKLDTIGLPNAKVPDEIEKFVKTYIDVDEIFESLLLNKLKELYKDLKWEFPPLNANVNKFFAF